jgi:hypothetical protein
MSYRNSYRTHFSAPATLSGGATEKQRAFALRLMGDINEAAGAAPEAAQQAAIEAIGAMQHLAALVSDAWADVSKADASATVDALLATSKALKAAAEAPVVSLPGLPVTHRPPFPARFDRKQGCETCGADITKGVDWCVEHAGRRFKNYCVTCASTDPTARREALVAAAQAEREARAAAQAARKAEQDALDVLTGVGIGLARQAFAAMGLDHHQRPLLRFALPSVTGNNDLDFFTVSVTSHRGHPNGVRVCRVIGGHADQPIPLAQGVEALKRLTDGDVAAACRLYGQKLEHCCACGRHLTDESSRLAGIGPECAKRI